MECKNMEVPRAEEEIEAMRDIPDDELEELAVKV